MLLVDELVVVETVVDELVVVETVVLVVVVLLTFATSACWQDINNASLE